jgi:hypothetical protein
VEQDGSALRERAREAGSSCGTGTVEANLERSYALRIRKGAPHAQINVADGRRDRTGCKRGFDWFGRRGAGLRCPNRKGGIRQSVDPRSPMGIPLVRSSSLRLSPMQQFPGGMLTAHHTEPRAERDGTSRRPTAEFFWRLAALGRGLLLAPRADPIYWLIYWLSGRLFPAGAAPVVAGGVDALTGDA